MKKFSASLESAAAIENDETMIINSDHSIITTPVESPQTSAAMTIEEDTSPSSDTSTSDAIEKNKRHRMKARSESNRSQKYENVFFFLFVFVVN